MWKALHILEIMFSLERLLLFLVRICRLCHLQKPSNLLIQGKNLSVVQFCGKFCHFGISYEFRAELC